MAHTAGRGKGTQWPRRTRVLDEPVEPLLARVHALVLRARLLVRAREVGGGVVGRTGPAPVARGAALERVAGRQLVARPAACGRRGVRLVALEGAAGGAAGGAVHAAAPRRLPRHAEPELHATERGNERRRVWQTAEGGGAPPGHAQRRWAHLQQTEHLASLRMGRDSWRSRGRPTSLVSRARALTRCT